MTTITMYDSVSADQIPPNAQAAAGYIGGRFPDFLAIAARFPVLHKQGRLISIAINAQEAAMFLDVETGDATPADAPGWVERMLKLRVWRPGLYANASTMPSVTRALAHAGIPRADYRLWVAEWTGHPHIPAGFEACQWTNQGPGGRNDDTSLCTEGFFSRFQPTDAGPHGLVRATLVLDMASGRWHVHHEPGAGSIHFVADRWASAQVQINEKSGKWRVHPMPFNAPPLGGKD